MLNASFRKFAKEDEARLQALFVLLGASSAVLIHNSSCLLIAHVAPGCNSSPDPEKNFA
jgi:hypothetical protein